MGAKTEIIKLIGNMPDEAKKEVLQYIRKVSEKYRDKSNSDYNPLDKFIELSSQNRKYGFKGLDRQELYND